MSSPRCCEDRGDSKGLLTLTPWEVDMLMFLRWKLIGILMTSFVCFQSVRHRLPESSISNVVGAGFGGWSFFKLQVNSLKTLKLQISWVSRDWATMRFTLFVLSQLSWIDHLMSWHCAVLLTAILSYHVVCTVKKGRVVGQKSQTCWIETTERTTSRTIRNWSTEYRRWGVYVSLEMLCVHIWQDLVITSTYSSGKRIRNRQSGFKFDRQTTRFNFVSQQK